MSDMVPVNGNNAMLSFGQRNLDAGDFVPPRIKVVQQMSAEATAEIDPAKPGDLVNTLTGENFGKTLTFVPLDLYKQRIFLVRDERRAAAEAALGAPLPDGTGLMCRSVDMFKGTGFPGGLCDKCPLAQWSGEGDRTPPLCSETYNIAAASEMGDMIILSFSKSSAKAGKKLFSALALSHAEMWSRVWHLFTLKMTKGNNTFFALEAKLTPETPSPELLRVISNRWLPMLRGGQVKLDVTEGFTDEEDAAPVAEGEAAF